jgi:hypothetical protein
MVSEAADQGIPSVTDEGYPAEPQLASDALQLTLRFSFRARLKLGVRWPARRVVGAASYAKATVGRGGWRGSTPLPGGGGVRGSDGRPGHGRRRPRRQRLPPPNNALEWTGHSAGFFPRR